MVANELVEAVRIVKSNESYINKKLELLYHIAQGLSNREVSKLLFLSKKVKTIPARPLGNSILKTAFM